jgi:hypothetical protein
VGEGIEKRRGRGQWGERREEIGEGWEDMNESLLSSKCTHKLYLGKESPDLSSPARMTRHGRFSNSLYDIIT